MAKPVIVRRLAHTPIRDLPRWATHTRLEWAKTHTPEPVSSRRAISILFPEVPSADVEGYRLELLGNSQFFETLHTAMLQRRGRRSRWVSWVEFFYIAVRIMKPNVVCEAGVFDGESSAVVLLALEKNQAGSLISIDLPATGAIRASTDQMFDTSLPPGCQPGWIVPESLRGRWRLLFGDSKVLLPAVLNENPALDIFFHDSLHTFDHQYFEYSAAWPHIREGGLLVSDDILWSHAFHKFCTERGKRYVNIGDRNHIYWPASNEGFGAVRK